MRAIKFRGVTSKGKIVYGYAFKYFKQKSWYILDERAEQWKIKSESLAQLVGYDSNGKEVYEGDTIAGENGYETVVYYHDNPDFVRLHSLKEVSTPR